MNEYTELQITANKAASSPSSSGYDYGTTIGSRLPDVIMEDDDSEHSTNEVGIVTAEPDALDEVAGSAQVRARSKMLAPCCSMAWTHSYDGTFLSVQLQETTVDEPASSKNNYQLPSFNNLSQENETGISAEGHRFKEWYEVVHVRSYNNELLTILPYVVID